MPARHIEHRDTLQRPFDDVVDTLTTDNAAILDQATRAAAQRVAELAGTADDPLTGFDASEPVTIVVVDPTVERGYQAFVDFTWTADPTKRLLANTTARLELRPHPHHRDATELILRADYQPTPGAPWRDRANHRARRILHAALERFLHETTTAINHHLDTTPPAPAPESPSPDTGHTESSRTPASALEQFTRILFAVPDPGPDAPHALADAIDLATANNATLTLLGVVAAPPHPQRHLRLPDRNDRLSDLIAAEVTARLDSWATASTVPITVQVIIDNPVTGILDYLVAHDHDLLVIAADTSSATAATTRRLLRLCPVPVWLLRPDHSGGHTLAAIDPGDDPALNRRILRLAAAHADRSGGDLHVVHAWELHGEGMLATSEYVPVSGRLLAELADHTELAHRDALQRCIDDADIGPHQVHLVNASPTRAVTSLVNLYRIDLVVMGSIGRTGIAGLLAGNTAEQLFSDLSCSMLVPKPPGFHSPALTRTATTPTAETWSPEPPSG